MKKKKAARKLSEGQAKDRVKNWKDKAIARRQENERLRKRIKELEASRALWKDKYKTLQQNGKGAASVTGEKAARHQYSLAIIVLIVELYKYGGMSLRSCRHSLCCMFVCLGLSSRVPSHSSIRNWLCKCGEYRVNDSAGHSGEYVIYIDESISFGSEKILLILAIRKELMTFSRALTHEDMEVLYVGVRKEWKAEAIVEILSKVTKDKKILYAVSDEGNNLVKTYKLLDYIHLKDCTHKLANFIKRLFEQEAAFVSFRKLIGKLRQAWNLSKSKSQYMPRACVEN